MNYESLKKILFKNKNNIIIISLEIFLGALIIFYFSSFVNNLGPENFVILFWTVFISEIVILFLVLTILAIKIIEKIKGKKSNNWFKSTILLMVIFLVVGWGLITFYFGETEINLVLRNTENIGQVIGNITCGDDAGKLIVNHKINCKIYPSVSIASANVTFTLYNGSKIIDDFSSLSFVAPDNCKYVYFKISGLDQDNKIIKLEVGYPISFYTEEENQNRNEKYIGFIILLFGAVLFSVPSMMNNFKQLNKHETQQRKRIRR